MSREHACRQKQGLKLERYQARSPPAKLSECEREQSIAKFGYFCVYRVPWKEGDSTRQVEGESWVSCHPGLQ